MTDENFIALVNRLEGEAARQPSVYRLRVLLLALLGYGYVLGILAATVALIVARPGPLYNPTGGKV